MGYQVRPFRETDAGEVISISDSIYPKYRENGWRPAEQFESECFTNYRYVAESTRLLGYGAIRYLREGQGRIDVMVHPQWQRGGVGSNLIERLLKDLVATNSLAAHARVREDHEEAVVFLRHRGFVEHQRMYGLKLYVPGANADLFRPLVSRLRAAGIQIATLSRERACDSSCINKLLDLYNSVLPSWPDPEPVSFKPVALPDFTRKLEREAGSQPDALFIAKTADLYVGYSGMFALGTAVRPEFRGKGIATALKSQTIRYAQKIQMQSAITCTANPAMLSINLKLGYQRQLVEIRMMKALSPDQH